MSSVAQYMHLCFQARLSKESHLAPHPELSITLVVTSVTMRAFRGRTLAAVAWV